MSQIEIYLQVVNVTNELSPLPVNLPIVPGCSPHSGRPRRGRYFRLVVVRLSLLKCAMNVNAEIDVNF